MKTYKEIKEQLLKEEDIITVNIDSNKKMITIIPDQRETYGTVSGPLRDYLTDGWTKKGDYINYFAIGGRKFKLHNSEHFNGQIYSIKIKEIA